MWRAAAVLAVLTVGGPACGSDGDKETPASSAGHQVPASEVAEALGKLKALVAQISLAASADAQAAKEQLAEIDELWEPIEASVKEKDSGLYDRLDDGFANLKTAVEAENFAQAQGAAADVDEAAKTYLAKFPG